MIKHGWKLIPIIVFLGLCVFFWRGLSLDPHHIPSVQIGKKLPNFSLPQLDNPQKIVHASSLRHHVVLLNVWASWCPACLDEQVFMLQLAREGVRIYGLNYKDNRKQAMEWLSLWGNPYTQVIVDKDGKTAIDLGVYGAPETFVIDKKGIIRFRHVGVLNQEIWGKEIAPLMLQLEQEA